MTGTVKISDVAQDVLQSAEITGNSLALQGQLDRNDYVAVNKILEALGGKWNRKEKAHIFESDPSEAIADVVSTGEYTDEKKKFQFYETPDSLADTLADHFDLGSDTRILEPSAGRGALIRAAIRSGGHAFMVNAVEINKKHHDELTGIGCSVHVCDFLELAPEALELPFDAILMNPPFTRSQDIRHVRHAYGFLADRGRLGAIMSPGWTYREDRTALEFREWLDDVEHGWQSLPDGSFKSSGTAVRSILLTIDK